MTVANYAMRLEREVWGALDGPWGSDTWMGWRRDWAQKVNPSFFAPRFCSSTFCYSTFAPQPLLLDSLLCSHSSLLVACMLLSVKLQGLARAYCE